MAFWRDNGRFVITPVGCGGVGRAARRRRPGFAARWVIVDGQGRPLAYPIAWRDG